MKRGRDEIPPPDKYEAILWEQEHGPPPSPEAPLKIVRPLKDSNETNLSLYEPPPPPPPPLPLAPPRGNPAFVPDSTKDDIEIHLINCDSLDAGPINAGGQAKRWFNEQRQHTLYLTGCTREGNSVSLKTTVNPSFLVKLMATNGYKWTAVEIDEFLKSEIISQWKETETVVKTKTEDGEEKEEIQTKVVLKPRYYRVFPDPDNRDEKSSVYLNYASAFCGWEEVWLKDLDAGFTGIDPVKFQFIRLNFTTLAAMQKCANRIQSPAVAASLAAQNKSVALYEANIPPLIRFLHSTKVEPAGWCRLPANSYEILQGYRKDTSAQITINLPHWHQIVPVQKEEIAPFRQVSFDIETYSPDDGKFSTAQVHDNYVIQIATYIEDFGRPGLPWKYIYVFKRAAPIGNQPNVHLVEFETERALLLGWAQLIHDSDPDLLHAYNGWDFDFGYLAERAIVTECWDEFRKLLGRIDCIPTRLVEKSMSSGAYGDNHWKMLPMSGRLVFDLMIHLQREFKLDGYGLKAVSEHFLSVKLGTDPLTTTKGSRTVVVDHANHGLAVDSVIHFSGIDTPDIMDDGDKSFYVFAGWTYEELHGDQYLLSGLHVVTRVLSPNSYEFEMSRPATVSTKGGGRLIKVFETKHEMDFPEMFRAFREQDLEKLRKVALYCIQDTVLPQKIMNKLCILPNLIEMAKVTWVPIQYLFERGQQIKVFSQLSKAALENGWAVPTVRKIKDEIDDKKEEEEKGEGYAGGIVLEPAVDFYTEPVGVLDFSSLYPSWIIDGNFCFTSVVKNPAYDNLPGVQYHRVQISETKTNVFAMNYNGLLPGLLIYLLQTRNKRKKMMEEATDPLGRMIHNGAQLALKVSANSAYGFTGVTPAKSLLPCVAIAESTTKCGRDGTLMARDFAENMDNFRDVMQCTTHFPLYYTYLVKNVAKNKCFHLTGKKLLDTYRVSLAENLPEQEPIGDEPVLKVEDALGLEVWSTEGFSRVIGFSRVKRPYIEGDLIRVHTEKGQTLDMNRYSVKTLDSPPPENEQFCKVVYGDSVTGDTPVLIRYPDKNNSINYVNIEDVPIDEKGWQPYTEEKEYATVASNIETWSDKGFTKLERIIRHKTGKDIYRVLTHTGVVKVTSDHSLLFPNGKEVRPVDVKVGDELMHHDLPPATETNTFHLEKPCMYAMGLFMGDGSCGVYDWAINNTNLDFLNKAKEELDLVYGPALSFHILDTIDSSGVYKLVPKGTGIIQFVCEWRKLFYSNRKQKIVPEFIMNSPIPVMEAFMQGFYAADGDKDVNGYYRFDQKGQVGSAGLLYLISKMGYKTSINVRSDKLDIYRVTGTKSSQRKNTRAIKRIENLGPTAEYVYDLQTANHHFAAGVGKMVVHNTDSIFCLIGSKHLKTQAQKVAYCGIACALISHRVTEFLRARNPFRKASEQWMTLSYEKTYRYWILFSKKRYIGEMTEFDPYKFTDDEKGVAKKRRDFCSFVKENYSKISKAIFNNDEYVTRQQRIQDAFDVVRKAVEDLLNYRVPFEKLVISKLLKDHYKVREKKQTVAKKSGSSFGPHNVFVDDLITWKQQALVYKGIVEIKRDDVSFADSPLAARVLSPIKVDEVVQLNYGDIVSRGSSVMHLTKILNPQTTEKELEPITHPHVRLTRRMYLRDPATAPSSGTRVPYVFCEPENPSVLQYLRAENPTYAKIHKMKVDPLYYLQKQCVNAWGQILNTVCPGVVDGLFAEAYDLYEKRQSGQLDLRAFVKGTENNRKKIKLASIASAAAPPPPPAAAATAKEKKSQSNLSTFFGAALKRK